MKALIFETYPVDVERRKASIPATPVFGAYVYQAQAAAALLKYGSYDRCFVACADGALPRARQGDGARGAERRLMPLFPAAAAALSPSDDVVFLTGWPGLDRLTPLRARLRRFESPIVGAAMSLHDESIVQILLRMLLANEVGDHDAIICPTEAGRRVIEHLTASIGDELERAFDARLPLRPRLPVIPFGVDVDEWNATPKPEARRALGVPDDAVMLLYVGRFSTLYKCDMGPLLVMFARSQARRAPGAPRTILCFAGDDTQFALAARLREIAARLGIGDDVLVRPDPTHEEKQALFAAADIFLSPSDNLQETFGIAVTEAMAAGLPIVASDWNGYKELVRHEATGFLVPSRMPRYQAASDVMVGSARTRSPELIALTTAIDLHEMGRCVDLLVSRPELRRRLGEAARAEARARFDWPRVVAQYEALWAELVEHGRTHGAAGLQQARPHLRTFDYTRVFAHYPTAFLDETDVIALDRADLSDVATATAPEDTFDRDLFQHLITMLGLMPVATLGELADGCGGDGMPERRDIVQAHVARLLKYGVVSLVSSPCGSGANDDAMRRSAGAHDACEMVGVREARYRVIASPLDELAVWPFASRVPSPWRSLEMSGTKDECQVYIQQLASEGNADHLRRSFEHGMARP